MSSSDDQVTPGLRRDAHLQGGAAAVPESIEGAPSAPPPLPGSTPDFDPLTATPPPATPAVPVTGVPAGIGEPSRVTSTGTSTGTGTGTGGSDSGKAETVKQEAGDVASTAAQQAGSVAATAKDEAGAVAHEAKTQLKDLYSQTQGELREQAATQQQRVAEGLRTVGSQLQSMARNSEEPGIATDLVQQVSSRVSGAAEWLGNRDPGSLLSEVKNYARRNPGTFIAVAALAGLAAGRLTRALAESAKEANEDGQAQA